MQINVQMAEQLNAKAQKLNSDRQKKLGMQEAAKQAYEKAVAVYKQKFGVELTDANLQAEYNEVYAKLQEDYKNLEKLVTDIESGKYNKSENSVPLITPVIEEAPKGVQTSEAPVKFGQPSETPGSTGVSFQKPTFNPTLQNNNEENKKENKEDISDQSYTPDGWGKPDKGSIDKNFSKILGDNF